MLTLLVTLLPSPAHATDSAEARAADPKIVHGQEESGYDFAVALGAEFNGTAFASCTGSLITPRIILTAAHCGADLSPELIVALGKAFFGPSVDAPTATIGFTSFTAHPDYEELSNGLGGTLGHNDVSIAVLSEDAPVAPVWVREDAVAEEEIGTSMTSIGFGITNAQRQSGSGVKRSATLLLSDVDETFLYSENDANPDGGQICSGDSGGPQVVRLPDGRVEQWAVHSWGDSRCMQLSGSTRVDVVMPWILEQVEAVHGSTDFCAINGYHGNGTCDAFCDADPECLVAEGDAAEEDAKGACSTVPAGSAGVLGMVLAGVASLRRRRGATQR